MGLRLSPSHIVPTDPSSCLYIAYSVVICAGVQSETKTSASWTVDVFFLSNDIDDYSAIQPKRKKMQV